MKTTFTIACLFLGSASVVRAQDAIVPEDFPTIRAAVQNAQDQNGDGTIDILVRAGTYNERVTIRRSNLTLRGEGADVTTIDSLGPSATIRVRESEDVTISDLTVRNNGNQAGLRLTRVVRGQVSSCIVTDCRTGVFLERCRDTTVAKNESFDNRASGFKLWRGSGNEIAGNLSRDNRDHGFYLRHSDDNLVIGNEASENRDDGLRVRQTTRNAIQLNAVRRNGDNGLRLEKSTSTLVSANVFEENGNWGIRLKDNTGTDFSEAPGQQPPPGDNKLSGNASGGVHSGG